MEYARKPTQKHRQARRTQHDDVFMTIFRPLWCSAPQTAHIFSARFEHSIVLLPVAVQ